MLLSSTSSCCMFWELWVISANTRIAVEECIDLRGCQTYLLAQSIGKTADRTARNMNPARVWIRRVILEAASVFRRRHCRVGEYCVLAGNVQEIRIHRGFRRVLFELLGKNIAAMAEP